MGMLYLCAVIKKYIANVGFGSAKLETIRFCFRSCTTFVTMKIKRDFCSP